MQWIRSHPFAVLFASAGLILLAIVMGINSTRIPSSSFQGPPVVAVSGGSTFQDRGISQPQRDAPPAQGQITTSAEAESDAPRATPPMITVTQKPGETMATSPSPLYTAETNYDSLLSSIYDASKSTTQTPIDTSATDSIIREVYALIPSTYSLSIAVPGARTSSQQTLYAYGNQAGLAVASFQNEHADMADVLKTWFEDRKSSSAALPARTIADDMISVGDALLGLPNVPPAAASVHQNLAQSYRDAGRDLLKVLEGGSDSQLVDSMKIYNATAENFTRNYVALVDLFEQNNVVFSSTDMGGAFSPVGSSF